MEMKSPPPLTMEHQSLLADLNQARHLRGLTAKAADRVGRLMQPHYAKEEEIALPQLGLMQALANGHVESGMMAAAILAERLQAELPNMLAEHRMIIAALEELMAAATKENHPQVTDFVEKMMLHIQYEEMVTYPAAILVGKHVKMLLEG